MRLNLFNRWNSRGYFSSITVMLVCAAVILLSLAVWSVRLSARLDNQQMLIKGIILLVYAVLLAIFALRSRPRIQRIMLLGLVIALAAGEIVTRIINPAPEDPDYRQDAPYIMFAGTPNGIIENTPDIHLTALGYRDDVPIPKPPDEYRIIMLGGSTVFNGSPREVSIVGAMENTLHDQGQPHIRIYNWGVYSSVSGQELAAILFRAVDYAPDMILVYDGSNDLTEPFIFDPRPGYPFDFMAVEGGRRIIEGHYGLYDLYALLLRPTSLGYTLFQFEIQEQITRRSQLAQKTEEGTIIWQQAIVDQYAANLGKMCELASAFDFQLVAVLQPMIFFKDRLTGDEPNWLGTADYQNHTRSVYDMTRDAYRRLSQQYADMPCTFQDGSRLLANETAELFVDPVHLNDSGRQIIGRRLAGMLVPLLSP